MRRGRPGWIAAVTLTALVNLATLGLYHVYAHAHGGHSDQCATCRVVGSSTTLASAQHRTSDFVAATRAAPTPVDDPYTSPFFARPNSRGPPSAS